MILNKFSDIYKKFERYISAVGLIYGFIFTSLTLTRVDAWVENFWIVINLLIAGLGIFVLTFYENRFQKQLDTGRKNKDVAEADKQRLHFYLTLIIQFAFGGLFSTFFVFYLRSASLIDGWIFLFLLLILLIGNEIWMKHYSRLTFQISVLFISLYLFLIFLLPVLFHRLGADLFVISGILSLIISFSFTLLLRKFAKEKFKYSHRSLKISVMGLFVLMNVLYFTNIIPPIPLSLRQAGVYHSIKRTDAVNYEVTAEPTIWSDYFDRYPVFHKRAGEPVYVFSSIFSPIRFDTKIVHQWQYYDEMNEKWVDSSKIILPITGGRENGYRLYSSKNIVAPGFWRVEVMTLDGKILGKINFKVENVTAEPHVINKTL
jgi:hypothetical protein